jgi:[FeFe] hydrogenase H-cluster maturation GTPase HydF
LDSDATAIVVKEREYRATLENLKTPPALVVCDSQVVLKMVADTPKNIKCTTFSTLFARYKGDLDTAVAGAKTIDNLKPGDKVLIAEACTHHALEDDIGRVKIPRWLRQYTGLDLPIDTYTGHDFPENISEYKLIIHCGSCMLNRRETLWRYELAKAHGIPITNYGVCISFLQGVLERVIELFR